MNLRQRTILSVAYPFAPVGPNAVGGAEQVLQLLESAWLRRGFHSLVAAHAASTVAGTLVGVEVPDGVLTPQVRAGVEARMQAAINAAVANSAIDLIHMHGIDFARYTLPRQLPILVTLHLPPAWYPPEIWRLPGHYTLQCVSASQRSACPADARARLVTVPNGVVVPPPHPEIEREHFALVLSRICPEKAPHLALDAARAAGVPVVLAGKVYPYPEHLEYFDREIEPRLGPDARFIGPVGGEEKQRLLRQARCLLIPSLAPETSSLVAMEALAAGTPVVAMRSGALPEIVEDGRTGFLVDDATAMTAAMGQLHRIDPEACRQAARERFDAEAMLDRYTALYETLMR